MKTDSLALLLVLLLAPGFHSSRTPDPRIPTHLIARSPEKYKSGTPPETTCGKRFKDDLARDGLTRFLKPCSHEGGLRCGENSDRLEYCSKRYWISLCPCPYHLQEQQVGTRINPGKSCNDIYISRGGKVSNDAYWIAPAPPSCNSSSPDQQYPFRVFCDMKTAGGGWTLVAKVRENDTVMNRVNTAQWRDGRLIGDTESLAKDDNALGLAYNVLQFRDVMIRSRKDSGKYVAWRHPTAFVNIRAIVQNCTRIANGVRISGDISNLHYRGKEKYHIGCTELVYGFMGGDYHNTTSKVAGCDVPVKHGHAGGIIGAFLDPPNGHGVTDPQKHPEKENQKVGCLSDFAVGGGYKDFSSDVERYAINAYYWPGVKDAEENMTNFLSTNNITNFWHSHAVFISTLLLKLALIGTFVIDCGYYAMKSAMNDFELLVKGTIEEVHRDSTGSNMPDTF